MMMINKARIIMIMMNTAEMMVIMINKIRVALINLAGSAVTEHMTEFDKPGTTNNLPAWNRIVVCFVIVILCYDDDNDDDAFATCFSVAFFFKAALERKDH